MERNEKGQFLQGQSGNPTGRPRGSRNKLAESFLSAVHEHWTEHGAQAIQAVYDQKPEFYLKVVMILLPDKFDIPEVDPFEGVDPDELDAIIAYCRKQVEEERENARQKTTTASQSPHLLTRSAPEQNGNVT